uniref:Putative carnitine o-acyltransferase crot n=1 Tax=Lutzomyia longipalpis TaxID=7200 RepID=A0A1B0CHY9_LUTLO
MNWIAQKSVSVLSNPSSRYLAANTRTLASSFGPPMHAGPGHVGQQQRNSSSQGKALENPQNLPSLPVPTLKETLLKFLTTAQPHLNEEEFRRTRSLVDKFIQPGSDGETLQKLLEARGKLKSNWLAEWWLKTAYLGYRDPVVVWSSPGIVFPERKFTSQRDRLAFAAKVITASLKFKEEIDNNRIPTEKFGKNELDMQQYRKIFGTCRIPGREIDTIEFNPASKHIAVIHRGNIFKVPVYGSNQEEILSEEELIQQLEECTKEDKNPYPVGILTSDNRNNWGKAHDFLLADPKNRASLGETQSALFVLCLDDAVPRPAEYKTVTSHQVITGGGSHQNTGNRWYDKTVQVAINERTALMDGHVGESHVVRTTDRVEDMERRNKKKRNPRENRPNYGTTSTTQTVGVPTGESSQSQTDAPGGPPPPDHAEASWEEEEGLKYGAQHVIKLFVPVSLCMLVVVATISSVNFYSTKDYYLLYTPFHETSPDTGTKILDALANSLILMTLIVIMTILLIILYKKRCYKNHQWMAHPFVLYAPLYLQLPLLGFIVGEDGLNGLTYEHTPAEGGPIAVLTDQILKYVDSGKTPIQSRVGIYEKPTLLTFNISEDVKKCISEAAKNIDALSRNLDMDFLHFKEFGKGFIKSQKISPDSFIQIALQYTFYRLHGVPGAHYESAHTRLFVHGRTETIRSCSNDSIAFAKSMMESGSDEDRFIVGEDGLNGLTYEHTPAEGGPIAVLTDQILKYVDSGKTPIQSRVGIYEKPTLLTFNISEDVKKCISEAAKNIDALSRNLDMDFLHFKEFGKGFIKSQKISPDSFIQIALQYTFYRLHGVPGAHYESAHTRLFVHGRTETIRSCSNDSIAFAKSMMESGSDEDRVKKLLAAINAHKDYTMQAMQGKGVDRHLLGLKLTAQENNIKVPELFSDAGYVKSSHMRLSTSQVASKYEAYMCYGPLVDNGYGCCYNPREDDMLFGISAFNSCPETSSKKFSMTLKESLIDMYKILSATGRGIKSKL